MLTLQVALHTPGGPALQPSLAHVSVMLQRCGSEAVAAVGTLPRLAGALATQTKGPLQVPGAHLTNTIVEWWTTTPFLIPCAHDTNESLEIMLLCRSLPRTAPW